MVALFLLFRRIVPRALACGMLVAPVAAFEITDFEVNSAGELTFEFEANTNFYYSVQVGPEIEGEFQQLTPVPGMWGNTNRLTTTVTLEQGVFFYRLRRVPIDEGPDRDADGLADLVESVRLGTDPDLPDTDYDGLSDGFEVNGGLNPLDIDSDSDNVYDPDELLLGTDPLMPSAFPHTVTAHRVTYLNGVGSGGSGENTTVASSAPAYLNAPGFVPPPQRAAVSKSVSWLNTRFHEPSADRVVAATPVAWLNAVAATPDSARSITAPTVAWLNSVAFVPPPQRSVSANPVAFVNVVFDAPDPARSLTSKPVSFLNAVQPSVNTNRFQVSPLVSYENQSP